MIVKFVQPIFLAPNYMPGSVNRNIIIVNKTYRNPFSHKPCSMRETNNNKVWKVVMWEKFTLLWEHTLSVPDLVIRKGFRKKCSLTWDLTIKWELTRQRDKGKSVPTKRGQPVLGEHHACTWGTKKNLLRFKQRMQVRRLTGDEGGELVKQRLSCVSSLILESWRMMVSKS